MKVPGLRAADEKVGGLVHFGRMLDKIRLTAAGRLPEGYFLGEGDVTWWDGRCCRLLGVPYAELRARVEAGASDESVIAWCRDKGARPNEEQIAIWNTFILKRGWRDESTASLELAKQEAGLGHRGDIVTWAELQRAEES